MPLSKYEQQVIDDFESEFRRWRLRSTWTALRVGTATHKRRTILTVLGAVVVALLSVVAPLALAALMAGGLGALVAYELTPGRTRRRCWRATDGRLR